MFKEIGGIFDMLAEFGSYIIAIYLTFLLAKYFFQDRDWKKIAILVGKFILVVALLHSIPELIDLAKGSGKGVIGGAVEMIDGIATEGIKR